jgi:glycogen debranching enzyme
MTQLQPLLADETVVLRAPVQAWSSPSGSMGDHAIHGAYVSDTRFVSRLEVTFDGMPAEHIATVPRGADGVDFVGILRHSDDPTADPRTRVTQRRTVTASGLTESITVASGLDHRVVAELRVRLGADLARMDDIKSGLPVAPTEIPVSDGVARWGRDGVTAELHTDAELTATDDGLDLGWHIEIPPHGEREVSWSIAVGDTDAVVTVAHTAADWRWPEPSGDARMDAWLARARDDLDALRMSTVAEPDSVFLAAGAPWFFTLFGRDSIWVARLLLPLGGTLARGTLRVLASMQGTRVDDETGEQPGKIPHELRRSAQQFDAESLSLPPLYYGTIDATPLWVSLLCDAADFGMPKAELEELLPNLESALTWLRDFGDADGDGLLEYINRGGGGLANQGWKDSGDSVQWKDGRLATAPIALCEVQAYAYEAATRGADLLERFGRDGAEWRSWAEHLRARFNEQFWVDDPAGAYPAIALDADKCPVDSLTSNIGHLLGTGLLDDRQSELIASRLVSDELNSGYGLRTMATGSAGYWPLSYHGGSVWAHDTAIAIHGLTNSGHTNEALVLCDGLLAAAESFDYRMPELHSGDAAETTSRAIPYPAACRPQAWSAAAAVAVHAARRRIAQDLD